MSSREKTSSEGGYEFVECSDAWKAACSKFPCLPALQWPGYRTNYSDIQVLGKDVVVQVWKGHCQQALGIDDAPGGIGAEVGVYRRLVAKPSEDLPRGFLHTLLDAAHGAVDLWLPYTDLDVPLAFELVDPQSGETFFKANTSNSYWCCKWMKFDSHDRWKKEHLVPTRPDRYRMVYWVDGAKFVWD